MEYVCELTDDYPGIEFGDDEYSGTCDRREKVVRCRDCAMRGPDGFCDLIERRVMPDGFCAWGERRGE